MNSDKKEYDRDTGDWGVLPQEPCPFCFRVGGVEFYIDEGPGRNDPQMVHCTLCGRSWDASVPRGSIE